MSGDFDARFLAAVSGSELDDLRVLGDHVPRPELRKPRRKQAVGYQVNASLNNSEPRIWRFARIALFIALGAAIGLNVGYVLLAWLIRWVKAM